MKSRAPEQDVHTSEDRVSPIDVEVLVENFHRAAVVPADSSGRPFSGNLVLLEPSPFPEDFLSAELNADFALHVPPMVRIPAIIRPVPRFVAALFRRVLNPFSCVQRLFNRAMLKLVDRLRKDSALLELEVARQRQIIRKLEKIVSGQTQAIHSLQKIADLEKLRRLPVEPTVQ